MTSVPITKSKIYSTSNTITAVTLVGGGAGGNGGQENAFAGGGGGSGEVIIQYGVTIPPNTNIMVTIGDGETGGQGGISPNPPIAGQAGSPTTISWPAENPTQTIIANGAPSPPISLINSSNGGNGAPIGILTASVSSSAGGGGAAGGDGGLGSSSVFNGEPGPSFDSTGIIRSGSGNGVEAPYLNGGFNNFSAGPNSYYGGGGGAWAYNRPYPPNSSYGLGKSIMSTASATGLADGYLYGGGGGGGGGASFGLNIPTDVTLLNGGNGAPCIVVFYES